MPRSADVASQHTPERDLLIRFIGTFKTTDNFVADLYESKAMQHNLMSRLLRSHGFVWSAPSSGAAPYREYQWPDAGIIAGPDGIMRPASQSKVTDNNLWSVTPEEVGEYGLARVLSSLASTESAPSIPPARDHDLDNELVITLPVGSLRVYEEVSQRLHHYGYYWDCTDTPPQDRDFVGNERGILLLPGHAMKPIPQPDIVAICCSDPSVFVVRSQELMNKELHRIIARANERGRKPKRDIIRVVEKANADLV